MSKEFFDAIDNVLEAIDHSLDLAHGITEKVRDIKDDVQEIIKFAPSDDELDEHSARYKVALAFACRKDQEEQYLNRCEVDVDKIIYALKQADALGTQEKLDFCRKFYK